MSGKAPDLPLIASRIRDCAAVLMNDLETVRVVAGRAPGCDEAIKRAFRQVAEFTRLADELHLPPGAS